MSYPNREPHEFYSFATTMLDDCAECMQPKSDSIHAVLTCDCCGRLVVELPYSHNNHNPPYDGYDYCKDCNGCGGPSDCCVTQAQENNASTSRGTSRGTHQCRYCGLDIFLVEIVGPLNGKDSFWFSDDAPDCEDHSPDGEHRPKETSVSNTMSDVDKAEMMLSLGMNEQGETLSNEEREVLQQYVDTAKGAVSQPAEQPVIASEPVGEAGVPAGDLEAMIQAQIQKALGGGALPAQQVSFDDVLKNVDPKDSEIALAMFQYLCDTGRMQLIGTLNGGGYMMHYQEPKGTTKAGYIPGATKGGRMVDQALDKAKASGATARKTGMCDKCWSAVEQQDDGVVVLDGSTDVAGAVCSAGGAHTFNA